MSVYFWIKEEENTFISIHMVCLHIYVQTTTTRYTYYK